MDLAILFRSPDFTLDGNACATGDQQKVIAGTRKQIIFDLHLAASFFGRLTTASRFIVH
jgi:hypothetical protein